MRLLQLNPRPYRSFKSRLRLFRRHGFRLWMSKELGFDVGERIWSHGRNNWLHWSSMDGPSEWFNPHLSNPFLPVEFHPRVDTFRSVETASRYSHHTFASQRRKCLDHDRGTFQSLLTFRWTPAATTPSINRFFKFPFFSGTESVPKNSLNNSIKSFAGSRMVIDRGSVI